MIFEYYKIFISVFIIFLIALVLFLVSYLSVPRTYDSEKNYQFMNVDLIRFLIPVVNLKFDFIW